jgi:hypothetical protein
MSPFEVVQAIQSAGVGVVGLDSRRTGLVLRSVDDQDAGKTAVIRFRCVSQRIEKSVVICNTLTNVVSSNPVHGKVYSIQHYVLKFVSDLRQVGGLLRFPPAIKLTAPI